MSIHGKRKAKKHKTNKRENKTDDSERPHTVKFVEPTQDSSDETDNEHEESEQDSTPSTPPRPVEEPQIKNRKNKGNKGRQSSPVLNNRSATSNRIEGILINKDEKSPVTAHPQPIPHPILATTIPKDEVALAKQHHQQTQNQSKQNQSATSKPTTTRPNPSVAPKKTSNSSSNGNQEQSFTTVVNNRSKGSTSSAQQTLQPTATLPTSTPTASTNQPKTTNGVQQDPLPQRQTPRSQQAPVQVNGLNGSSSASKQAVPTVSSTTKPPVKVADLIKALPTSQAVVTELMFALDAYPLSADELDIVMHKIANKQAVIKQDWTKLQHGQKVDPQVHIGQVLDESAKAYEEDVKTNGMKRIKDLTEELNNEKRRVNDLLKEKSDNEASIQILRNQLDNIHHQQPSSNQINAQQQHQYNALKLEAQRLSDENMELNKRLLQQQQQQQILTSANHTNNNGSTHPQIEVMTNEVKRLAMVNSNLERQLKTNEETNKKFQDDKENLQRTNQKLIQDIQELRKQLQIKDDNSIQELNETRTKALNQQVEYERRIAQINSELDQFKSQEKLRVETLVKTSDENLLKEERERFEHEMNQLEQTIDSLKNRLEEQQQKNDQVNTQLINENIQLKNSLDQIQNQSDMKETNLRQELENLKLERDHILNQQKQTNENEIVGKNSQIGDLQAEIEKLKNLNQSLQVEHEQMKIKTEFLEGELSQIQSRNEALQNENEQGKPEIESLRSELEQVKASNVAQQIELEKATNLAESQKTQLNEAKTLNETLRSELEQSKVQNDGATEQIEQRLHQEHNKYKQFLLNLLPEDVRSSFVSENQDFEQWLSSYREKHQAKIESEKASLHEECNSLKRENERLQQTMDDIESQLREIEQTVQTKEELLVTDLNDKTISLERAREENGRLNTEIKRLNQEIDRIRNDHDTALTEIQTLKCRVGEGPVLLNSALGAINDELSDFMRQSSPPEIDARTEELNELIRASKEALATQDSIVQLLDKRIDGLQPGSVGEANHEQTNLSNELSNNQQTEQNSNS